VPGLPSAENEQWWWDDQDEVDTLVTNWTSLRTRDKSVAILREAGVPAVPVSTAVDRAQDSRYRQRRVALPGPRHLKGFPMVLYNYWPPTPAPAPELGKNVTDWDENTADAFLGGALRSNV
jgi:crotonobetainyl-CoA:carnitine CoA-transferase CaiB-like acyl-CoA transferase